MDDQRIEEITEKWRAIVAGYVRPYLPETGLKMLVMAVKNSLREALSSQEEELRSLREELRQVRELLDRAVANTAEALRQMQAQDEALQLLRDERDAAMKVLKGGRLYTIPDLTKPTELQEEPTTLLQRAQHVAMSAESEAEIVDLIREERNDANNRAESAEAELQRLREGMK